MNGKRPSSERFRLGATLSAPRLARARVVAACVGVDGDDTDLAVLLTSELVTNAVLHGGPVGDGAKPEIIVEIQLTDRALWVGVFDGHPGPLPSPRPPRSLDESGAGLYLVSRLASAWGSRGLPSRQGKVVWFEIALKVPS